MRRDPGPAAGRRVAILGVPTGLGQRRRGVEMGPAAIRRCGLAEALGALGLEVADLGDVAAPQAPDAGGDVRTRGGLVFLDDVREVCGAVAARLAGLPDDVVPIVLGGDHSVAIGSATGAGRGGRVGVVWVDAHPDFDTPETSISGNLHGMALAAVCGHGGPALAGIGLPGAAVRPEDATLVGMRSLDTDERVLFTRLGGAVYTMRDVGRLGVARVAAEVASRMAGVPRVHVSLDADVLDPEAAPGVGTPVPNGMSLGDAVLLMESLARTGIVTSLDLVEVNPLLDRDDRTAAAMVALAAALLGAPRERPAGAGA